jgi:hypothetical protein
MTGSSTRQPCPHSGSGRMKASSIWPLGFGAENATRGEKLSSRSNGVGRRDETLDCERLSFPTANAFRRYFRANHPGPESHVGKGRGCLPGTGTRTRSSLPSATGRGSGASTILATERADCPQIMPRQTPSLVLLECGTPFFLPPFHHGNIIGHALGTGTGEPPKCYGSRKRCVNGFCGCGVGVFSGVRSPPAAISSFRRPTAPVPTPIAPIEPAGSCVADARECRGAMRSR